LITYSTCTLTVEENEGVVEWARRELGLRVEELPVPGPPSELAGLPAARFVPGAHDAPGFFLALLRKD